MARRRSSGLFETIVKSAFGFGTTVHYKKDWLGHSQKIVQHHDSGKKKTYTHGCGFFGNTAKTKTEKHGSVIEEGKLKQRFWGGADEHAERRDGTTVERNYRPGFFKNHITTHINGECWNCKGTGKVHFHAKPCFKCQGTGKVRNSDCGKCRGTGQHLPAVDKPCMKCGGSGRYSKTEYK